MAGLLSLDSFSAHEFAKRWSSALNTLIINHQTIMNLLSTDHHLMRHRLEDIINSNLHLLNELKALHINNFDASDNRFDLEESQNEVQILEPQDSDDLETRISIEDAVCKRSSDVVKGTSETNRSRREKAKPCQWPGCGYSTTSHSNLRKHFRVHTGSKPFVCDWPNCNRRYQQKPGLVTHQRKHLGEKPFACDWPGCDYKTNHLSALHSHRKTHTGDKYECDWPGCSVSCVSRGHLKIHRLTHTGDKPYECSACGQTFNRLGNLKAHNASVHLGVKRRRRLKKKGLSDGQQEASLNLDDNSAPV